MKKQGLFKKFFITMMCVACFMGIGMANFQVKQVKSVQVKRTIIGMNKQLAIPDLIATHFVINQGSRTKVGDVISFNFQVTIKNIGTAALKSHYYLSFQKYDDLQGRWGGERDHKNCSKVTRLLQPNEAFIYTGKIKFLNFELSNKTVRVKVYVDSGCNEEFPPAWRAVKELKEDNNFSNEVKISAAFMPSIAGVHPDTCIAGLDQIHISGNSFGSTQGNHALIIQKGNKKVHASIKKWYDGGIYFKVPASADTGWNKVYIADKSTLICRSNMVNLRVCKKKILKWSTILSAWDLFNSSFSIKLNTYARGSKYQNTSTIKLTEVRSIHVPLIQFSRLGVRYRSLVKHMDTLKQGITLSKQGCNPNQLLLEAAFESNGVEVKTFNKSVLGGKWCDNCVSDVHVNRGKMVVKFNFTSHNGNLDFTVGTSFNADVKASNSVADWFMNLFMRNWNRDVRDRIRDGVRDGLMHADNKNYIRSSLVQLIKALLGIGGRQITGYEFKGGGIQVTYY